MHLLTTTKPGEKYRSIKNPAVYEALRRRGYSKGQAARISNAQAKKRHKAFSIDTLERYVSSPHYDADLAALIARRIPALKALPEAPAGKGQPGEHIAQGITRIRGNLCNVHGKYGPCDKALSGKKKPGKGRAARKPVKTDQQRSAERDQKRQANIDSVAQRMADSDTGLSPSGSKALTAFAKGQQPTAQEGAGLASLGLAERASDGSYRMTPTGRAVVAAMAAGDYQRAVDGISRGTDQQGKRNERTTAAQARREAAQGKRTPRGAAGLAQGQLGSGSRSPLDALAQGQASGKKPATRTPRKASSAGGDKKPDDGKEHPKAPRAYESPRKAGGSRSSAPSVGGVAGAAGNKKPVTEPKPEKAPAKQIDPQLAEAATALSDGKEVSDEQIMALVRNGLAKLNKDGVPVLTAAGQRVTMKSYDGTLKVFKDITGAWRWVAQSSTAFQDRDREIVSTKALSDDCERADADGGYGPLRWWHTPGLDLGDCDFNAMHGRVLIESGTFRSAAIAQKIARAAGDLEISLGFLHLPTEPDADGVFHHIRRFERSLVPRGKASNRFTAFTVKESPVDTKKIEGLKQYGFSDADIAELMATAAATEKTADDQGVAYKAEEPAELPDVVINGVTYKAMPPVVEEDKAEPVVVETDAVDDMPMDDEPDDPNALTLSPGDIAAITEIITNAVSQIMGGLDLEKKVAGHVQGLLAPFQQAQATKETALTTQVAELKQQVDDLTGAQPAAPYRASQAANNVLTDASVLAAVKSAQEPGSGPWDDIIKGLGLGQPQ